MRRLLALIVLLRLASVARAQEMVRFPSLDGDQDRHLPDRRQARLPRDQPSCPATHLKFNRAGLHHRASLSIAAYGFLMAEQLIADKPVGDKDLIERQVPALPKDCIPSGSPARAAARGPFDHGTSTPLEFRAGRSHRAVQSCSCDAVSLAVQAINWRYMP